MTAKLEFSGNRWLLALIMTLGAVLDLYRLTSQPFWRDEGTSVAVAQSPWPVFVQLAYGYESGMAFYYTLLRLWLVSGSSDFAIRLFSVIFAIAALPTLYVLGARLFNERVGLVATLLLAVNVLFIQYAQEARSYTLTIFLVLASWLCMLDCVQRRSPLRTSAYILTTTLAAYSHALAILTLPAQLTALLLLRPDAKIRNRFLVDMVIVGLLFIPEILMIREAEKIGTAAWLTRPNLGTLEDLIVSFIGLVEGWAVAPSVRQSLEALYGLGFLLAVAGFVSGSMKGEEEARSYAVTAAALIVPVALLMGVSQIKPLFLARYVLICLPFFTLLAAAGLCRVRYVSVSAISIALLTIASLSADWTYYTHPTKPDWQRAIHYFTTYAREDDKVIVFPAYCRWEYDHNLKQFGDPAKSPAIVYPRWDSSFKIQGLYINSAAMGGAGPIFAAALSQSYRRLWVITCDVDRRSEFHLLMQMARKCRAISPRHYRRIWVLRALFCREGVRSVR